MPLSDRMRPITMTSVDAATLDPAVWTPLAVPLEAPLSMLRIVNASNSSVLVSYDQIISQDYVPGNTTLELDFQTNSMTPAHIANLSKSPGIFIQGRAGVGRIYCSGFTSFTS